MFKSLLKKPLLTASMVCALGTTFAQTDSTSTEQTEDFDMDTEMFDLSLEDLMNVNIVSASRSEESAFEVPLSSFVITGKEIELMGATSVPDALRACPGLIVREISNGTYDVSMRGGVDGFPAYNYSYTNTSILVMINNRPVFSSLQGGTYWQNLPVGMAEIDRIEVVHGPSSPLYGPNAVSGVINIITKTPKEIGTYVSANAQGGTKTNTMSLIAGEKFNDKFSAEIALNYSLRNRFDELFYDGATESYVPFDSLSSAAVVAERDIRFPNLDQSLRQFGGTINLYYDHSDDIKFMLSGATNHNMALQPLTTGAQLSNYTNLSQNIFLNASIHDLTVQTSVLYGKQGLTGNQHANDYNYANEDIYIDYNYEVIEGKLSVRPAISYQSAYANDKEFTVDQGLSGTFNNEGRINNTAGSLKLDARPTEKLRVILAGRYDKFNYPEEGVFSYQGILNYKLNDNNIIRAITGRSYNGSFLLPTLINTRNEIAPSVGPAPGMQITLNGNKNLGLMNNTLYEVGYRTKLFDNTTVDVALFSQKFQGFSNLILHVPGYDFLNNMVSFDYYQENLDLEVNQQGATIAIQTNLLDGKVQIRPNITIQKTTADNFSAYYNQQGAWDNPTFNYTLAEHIDSTATIEGKSTPKIFGGFNLIVKPIHKLTVDLSGYFYDDYIMHSGAESSFTTGQVVDQEGSIIASKFLMNLNIGYSVADNLNLYVNVRNITNQEAPEGFGSDRLKTNVLFGLTMNY